MTFQEKREQLLQRYDKAVAELRKVGADPLWTNEDYKPYKDAMSEAAWCLRHLRELNQAEQA